MDNAELLKQLEKKIKESNKGGTLTTEKIDYNKWLKENTGIKIENGKRITVWKTGNNVGKPFDSKEGNKVFFTNYYGTATPYKDLKYLKQAELTKQNISRLKRNKLRIGASKKDYKGNNLFLQEVDAREKKELKLLEELKKGTSFAGKTTNKKKDKDTAKVSAYESGTYLKPEKYTDKKDRDLSRDILNDLRKMGLN